MKPNFEAFARAICEHFFDEHGEGNDLTYDDFLQHAQTWNVVRAEDFDPDKHVGGLVAERCDIAWGGESSWIDDLAPGDTIYVTNFDGKDNDHDD